MECMSTSDHDSVALQGEASSEAGDKLDLIDAALCALHPTWRPLSESAKVAIRAANADAPPMSSVQARRVARLLRGRSSSE